ncbi:MAG: GNAT family N-acetyltransferase [Eubacteriaceae bacterium]|nr:GNAT family N-acetyltransferase [Eubacteriaceae bacterium]
MVREAKPENMAEIVQLIKSTGGGPLPELAECQIWYYTLDDKIVGVLGVINDDTVKILSVAEEYHGQDVGKELFEAVKTILMARGHSTIKAAIKMDSAPFFSRLHFKKSGEPYHEDGITVLPMEYNL